MSDLIELPEASPTARAAAASLIAHMRNEYGEKFARQWAHVKADDQIDHWARRLAGYTAGEVRRGLVALSTRPYPPTLPEFLGLCRPPIDAEAAFHEAVAGMQARQRGELGEWSHPAIYWAAVRVSSHDLLANGYAVMRGRWENALRDWLSKGRWADIPMPAVALPAPGAAVTSDDEARRRLKQLGAGGILHSAGSGCDTGWAQRILDREAAGRDRPCIAALRMARRALGVAEEVQA
ncbi:hypothetical protein [Pigmentiphaga kullae]|uniref:Uncharacterized protein n=1 Tax=Pigmentiphaga kullae TaxID=151784 RepID=A0A4Q7NC85_9BURK|nr:hypothetical protein [Pigmentiphaga kullae]RZS80638.1 hypothetical protein EV675_3250 [Pigmentiphaga kullae]